jgi:MFS family permease
MELLLFLSALLSALTGAISGAHAPEMQVHQTCGAAAVAQAVTAVQAVPARPVRGWLALAGGWQSPAARLYSAINAAPALFATIARYLDKPRE